MKKSWNVQLSNTNKNLLFKLSRFLKRQSVARVYDLPLSWSWHCLLHRVWCKSFSCFWKTLRELQVQEPSLRYLILPKLRWNHWRCLTGKGNFREAINNLALLLHAAAWSPLSKDSHCREPDGAAALLKALTAGPLLGSGNPTVGCPSRGKKSFCSTGTWTLMFLVALFTTARRQNQAKRLSPGEWMLTRSRYTRECATPQPKETWALVSCNNVDGTRGR